MAVNAVHNVPLPRESSYPRLSRVLPAEFHSGRDDNPFDDEDLKHERTRIDYNIEALRKPLFALARAVLERSKTAYPSSIVIDDASGRFVGRFIAEVLKAEKPVPVLCLRMINARIFEGSNRQQSLYDWMRINSEKLGSRPLIVSDILETGEHLAIAAALMNARGKIPDVAVLVRRASTVLSLAAYPVDLIESIASLFGGCRSFRDRVNGLLPARMHLRCADTDGRFPTIKVGKVLVGTTCFSRLQADMLAPQFDNNEALNGIGTSHRFSSLDPLFRPDSYIKESRKSADRQRRAMVIRHSRARLKDLAAEFWEESLAQRS